ncbi:MAG: CoA pyrophosphatase [Arenimonas sp.]|nr:CoA pyrophosphatase [Arenimonas sp.]
MPEHTIQRLARVLLSPEQAMRSAPCNLRDLEPFVQRELEQFMPASVLCALVMRDAGLHVLLTKRAGHLRHHAGQISFPGGRIEVQDADPYQAALREAQEEINLAPESVRFIGYLDPMLTITGFKVFPTVALLDAEYRAAADGIEVDELFEAPLNLFLDEGNERFFELEFQGAPRRLIEFRWQEYRIWGATAAMLINLRQKLKESV